MSEGRTGAVVQFRSDRPGIPIHPADGEGTQAHKGTRERSDG